jgi:hypothetical protein
MKNGKRGWLKITEEIIKDRSLDWTNKALLSEIYSLCQLEDGCYASDNHFSKFLGIGRTSVNKRINWLKTKGYINTYNHFDKNRCVGRTIQIDSSKKKHTLVLTEDKGSSLDIQDVVLSGTEGVSPENTINSFTRTVKVNQDNRTNTGAAEIKSSISACSHLKTRYEDLVSELVEESSLGEKIFFYLNKSKIHLLRDAVDQNEYKRIYPRLKKLITIDKQLFGG